MLATAANNEVKFWSLPGGALLKTIQPGLTYISAMAIASNGDLFACEHSGQGLRVKQLPEYKFPLWIKDKLSRFTGIGTVARNGKTAAVGFSNGDIELWSLPEAQLQKKIDSHNSFAAPAPRLAPDGSYLGALTQDHKSRNNVMIWALPKGKLIAEFKDVSYSKWDMTPTASLVAIGGIKENSIEVWSLPKRKLLTRVTVQGRRVSAVALSPDGNLLACFDEYGLSLWSLPSGELLARLRATDYGSVDYHSILSFSPDGKFLVSAWKSKGAISGQNSAILWDVASAIARRDCYRTYLFDPSANPGSVEGITYKIYDSKTERPETYAVPCGTSIPADAVCTCNCVPGTYVPPDLGSGSGGIGGYSGGSKQGTVCTCDKVCTCVPVPSSRRWKDNVQPIQDALVKTMQLRGVRFDWTDDAPITPCHQSDIGVIAEEVFKVVPEVVHLDENGNPRAVDYARLSVLLLEAVKAQQEQIDALRGEIGQISSGRSLPKS
jgi:WD40 repeat protein